MQDINLHIKVIYFNDIKIPVPSKAQLRTFGQDCRFRQHFIGKREPILFLSWLDIIDLKEHHDKTSTLVFVTEDGKTLEGIATCLWGAELDKDPYDARFYLHEEIELT